VAEHDDTLGSGIVSLRIKRMKGFIEAVTQKREALDFWQISDPPPDLIGDFGRLNES
jgi:hypothetical protein